MSFPLLNPSKILELIIYTAVYFYPLLSSASADVRVKNGNAERLASRAVSRDFEKCCRGHELSVEAAY